MSIKILKITIKKILENLLVSSTNNQLLLLAVLLLEVNCKRGLYKSSLEYLC